MAERVPNEFLTSIDDNRIRPYTVGLIQRKETLASIILFTSDETTSKGPGEVDKDYLADFSSRIQSLISEASLIGSIGVPELPNGKIPKIRLDGEHDYYGVFNNFSLMKVTEGHEQIVKVHQHFGGTWNAFFFGEKPRVYQFEGMFLDSEDYPYYQEFMVAYEEYLAGRKCIENKMQMKIMYDGRLIDGFMLNITTSHTAQTALTKAFSFTVLVRGDRWVRNNMYRANIDSQGRYIWDRGHNAMSNVHRLKALSDQSAIESQENDSSGNTVRTGQ